MPTPTNFVKHAFQKISTKVHIANGNTFSRKDYSATNKIIKINSNYTLHIKLSFIIVNKIIII